MEQRVDKIQTIQFSKREEALTKLIFQLADVLYVLMQENIKSMRSKGLDLKHDTKYRFIELLILLRKLKSLVVD